MRDPPRSAPWWIIFAMFPQGVPHTVLLQRSFYDAKLLPPLTLWALLWLRRARVSHGTDEQLYNYLSSTPTSEGGGVWDTLVAQLPEEHVQLLNLAHTWLSSVLPHVLCKVARVHYGLLPERDLLNTTPGDNLPQSRRLLAVPFIGKDVPSHAAVVARVPGGDAYFVDVGLGEPPLAAVPFAPSGDAVETPEGMASRVVAVEYTLP